MSTPAVVRCPQCTEVIDYDENWPSWCEACLWGLDPSTEDVFATSWWEKPWNARLSRITSASEKEQKPILTVAAATAVHLVTALIVVTGIAIWFVGIWIGFRLLISFFLLGAAWTLRPQPSKDLPPGHHLTDAPALHALIAKITKNPSYDVVVDASTTARTVPRGRGEVLLVGLPLWASIEGQAKVALLARALSPTMGESTWVWTARQSLHEWRLLLGPAPVQRRGLRKSSSGVGVVVGAVSLGVTLLPLTLLLGGAAWVLDSSRRAGQHRADRRAELFAVEIAGTDGALALSEALLAPEMIEFGVAQALLHDKDAEIWTAAHDHARQVPEHERRRRVKLAETGASDAAANRRLLLTLPSSPPTVLLPAGIDEEIRQAEAWVHDDLR